MWRLQELESRDCPATLDLVGGVLVYSGDAGANVVTQYVSGQFLVLNDPTTTISLGPGAVAAGWKGNGTRTVTGPRASVASEAIDLGGGNDTFNLRACDGPVSVDCTQGADAVNVSGNAPTNSGDLTRILAAVTATGDGDDRLWVSDQGATFGNANVLIDPAGVHGLAGPTDAVDILTNGTFAQTRVTGSGHSPLAESFAVAGCSGLLRLDTRAGADSVVVAADTSGVMFCGGQAYGQVVTVLAGVTWDGDVHTGPYAVTVLYGPPLYGDITGTVGF